MVTLGINLARTSYGMDLYDGSAAIVADGELLCAIPEERLSRKKNDTGWNRAANYCLESSGLKMKDVDCVAVSNCCDHVPSFQDVEIIAPELPQDKIRIVPSHHLSHANIAGLLSPFDEAMILVADNEGNCLDNREVMMRTFVEAPLERVSVFSPLAKNVVQNGRHFQAADSVGSSRCSLSFNPASRMR